MARSLVTLATGVRTGTTTGPTISTKQASGVIVTLDLTAVPGTDTITLRVEGQDHAGGWYTILQGVAEAAVAKREYVIYPAGSDVANVRAARPIGNAIRVVVAHSAASNFTYSVGVTLCN